MKLKRDLCPHCKVGYVYRGENYCANCGKAISTDILIKPLKRDQESGDLINEFVPVSNLAKTFFQIQHGPAVQSVNILAEIAAQKAVEYYRGGFRIQYEQ